MQAGNRVKCGQNALFFSPRDSIVNVIITLSFYLSNL